MNLNDMAVSQGDLDLQINLEKQIDHSKKLKEKAISMCVELAETLNERPFIFKYWSHKTGDRHKALVEYVDVLHFLLSYGNSIHFDFEKYKYNPPTPLDQRDLVLGLFSIFSSMIYTRQFEESLNFFLYLGECLRFSPEEIEKAYYEKTEVNYARQEAGY